MWKYIKNYVPFMVLAALCMVCEVSVDLLQPAIMRSIVDDGVLGVNSGGVGDMNVILRSGLTITTQLLGSVLGLVMLFQGISRGGASWKRVKEVLHTEPELKDGTFGGDTQVRGKIELRNVSFPYAGSTTPVLKNISLTIEPGETVGIMGATGCGKTTLVSLIPRFYDVTEGEVLVDGVDVREYRQRALRDKISVALQKNELFGLSVADNILWGDGSADREAVTDAAKVAQADEFISKMPEGYDTMVAERGMSLSGGQRQRVSIARAIIKPAEILIFDDATSALDLKTEAQLFSALNGVRSDVTRIIVAQRIASVKSADRIAVLDGGTLVAFAPHAELMETCAIYRDIYYSQLGTEEFAYG